jgi:hypothetical protein
MKRPVILTVALCLAVLLCLAPGATTAWAVDTTWSLNADGNWNTFGNWNNGIPDSSTNAFINDNSSTVTLDTTGNVLDLTIGSGNTLIIDSGRNLNVYGPTLSNDGNITMNSSGTANTFLTLQNNVTLSGAGTLTMNLSGTGHNEIGPFIDPETLTNQSTIEGAGIIGNGSLTLNNAGTINANSNGQTLILNGSGGVTNTNLLEASSGGTLQFNAVTVNNAGGNITANSGSNVELTNNATIQGGTLTNNGNFFGTLANNLAYLDGSTGVGLAGPVTINGTYTSDTGAYTYLLGTINNQGNIHINGASNISVLATYSPNITLQGGGTVTLSSGGGGNFAYLENYLDATGTQTLTNVTPSRGRASSKVRPLMAAA